MTEYEATVTAGGMTTYGAAVAAVTAGGMTAYEAADTAGGPAKSSDSEFGVMGSTILQKMVLISFETTMVVDPDPGTGSRCKKIKKFQQKHALISYRYCLKTFTTKKVLNTGSTNYFMNKI
jgi:hypothetical protein